MFYELPSFTWGGGAWGLRPISQHLRLIPDFASYRGFLVLGGNQVSQLRLHGTLGRLPARRLPLVLWHQ